jgi:outer membrane protein OmpA-like peptidoglycan-associated protein
MKRLFALFVILCCSMTLLYAQKAEVAELDTLNRPAYGIFGLFNLNSDAADFTKLPGVANCCPSFTSGSGVGFTIGAEYELPLPSKFTVSLRVGFNYNSTKLTQDEPTAVRVGDKAVPGTFQHIMKANLSNIFVNPMLNYNAYMNLFFHLGGSIGFVASSTYDQSEEITQPTNAGVFEDTGTRIRNKLSGTIPQAGSIAGDLKLGASWRFQMNVDSTLFLVPQAFYTIGLTKIATVQKKTGVDASQNPIYGDGSWSMSYLQLGVGLMFSPKPKPKEKFQEFKEEFRIDTFIVRDENILKSNVVEGIGRTVKNSYETADTIFNISTTSRTDTLFARTALKAELSTNPEVIIVKTQFVSEAFNTLARIFFDDNTPTISKFYNILSTKEGFSIEKLKINPFVFHQNILNIVGQRLNDNPNAEITLRGTSDPSTESGSCALAKQRVEVVREYLTSVWGIDPKRIRINEGSDCRPEDPTTSQNDSGYAENRRVEITSKTPQILAPIIRTKFSEVTEYNPQEIDIMPSSKAGHSTEKGIDVWSLKGKQGDATLFSFSGSGPAQPQNIKIDRDYAKSLSAGTIDVTLRIKDVEGTIVEAKKSIKVVKDTANFEVQRFSLILFNFNSTVIPDRAKPDILKAVEGITEESKIQITGYTDILGTRQRNQEIANGRAMNTADFIRTNVPKADIISVKGLGSSKFPPGIESYGSAAERFLSRTVQIEILRKIK